MSFGDDDLRAMEPGAAPPKRMTYAEWQAEGRRRFGDDEMGWRFVCPSCRKVAAVRDWRDAGAPVNAVAYSCVGRWLPDAQDFLRDKKDGKRFCNYAGGGLFCISPLTVVFPDGAERPVFAFADPVNVEEAAHV